MRSGTGNDVITFDEPVDMALIARLSHTGSSNFQVILFDENGDRVDTLANEIGSWSGEVPANFRDGEQFSFMEVTADGSWEVSFDDLLSATLLGTESGDTYAGTGSEVLIFNVDGPTIIDVDCPSCDSNVFIAAYGDRRSGVANEIGDGGYSASHLIAADTLMLYMDLRAGFGQGPPDWTITVQ